MEELAHLRRQVADLKAKDAENKKLVEKLKASESRFKAIVENSFDFVFTIDENMNVSYVSPSLQEISGYTPEEVVGKSLIELMQQVGIAESSQLLGEYLDKAMSGEAIRHLELTLQKHDGTSIVVEINGSVLVVDGVFKGGLLVVHDITEHKKIEENLRESEEKFRTIFENASDEIAYLDKNGTVIDVNDAIEDVFGFTREEVVGKKIYEIPLMQTAEWLQYIGKLKDILEGKTTQSGAVQIKATTKDKKTIYAEVNAKLIEQDGEVRGILAIIRNIDERDSEFAPQV